MTDGRSNNKYLVTMKKCNRNNQRQLWKCVGERIKQTQSGRYMYMYKYYGEHYGHVRTRKYWRYASKWTHFGSKKDVCSQAVGCDTFVDGSHLLILDKTKCEEQSECLGEKKIKLSNTKCFLLPNKTQYLHNDTWKALEIQNDSFEITVDKESLPNPVCYLQWDLSKTPESWGGLMVKVLFECEDSSAATIRKTEHCVVIKYTGTFKGFHDDGDDDDDGDDNDNDGDDNDGDNNDGNGGDKTNKDKTDADQKNNGGDKDNTQTIIIIVCVLVVLLLSGLVVFVIYKYRNRLVCYGRRNTERQDAAPKQEYADAMNPLYPANNNYSGQRECELYESTPDHVYQYVDTDHKTTVPPPQNLTYDYAVVDGPLTKGERSSVELDATGGKGTPLHG
ncbi:Hypothetical predicted protein [Paramuricea clavata]|uniref:Uncharacterized protein n=1 Tax=Paramuricea clavata TaxID=317549 RepID=A0A6S7H2M4_PARCT|nr:Hypothetical predicted protein [Paramuricea clavata]